MDSLKSKGLRNMNVIIYMIIFVLLFLLCLLFPYSGDDWAWGSQIGLDRLENWFDNYSGRYFGNLIVLALTRSNLLKAITMAVCLTGIIVILNKLTAQQKNGMFIISTVLVFMPVTLLRQAVVWTSGFANYTTSIFLTLIYIYYVNNIYGEEKPKYSFSAVVPLALLGFANALIVEHLTIYNVILSVYVIVFTLIKFKRVFVQHIAYLLGVIAGTGLMFSNSVYRSVADGSDKYRTIGGGEGIVTRMLKAYFGTIVDEGFFKNFVLNIFLVGVCLILWITLKNKLSKKARVIGNISAAVMVAFAASSVMLKVSGVEPLEILSLVKGGATAAYIIAFIVFLFVIPLEINKKMKLFFILGSTGCLIAPLLVVTPIGSRCFFAPYVMMIYLGMEVYSLFDDDIKEKCAKITKVTVITALVGIIYLFYIYGTISVCSNERIEKAQADAQNGAGTIQVEELPYSDYVWCSDLKKNIWQKRFKLFYGIDKSVDIEQISSRQKL